MNRGIRATVAEVLPVWEAILEVYLSDIPFDADHFQHHYKLFKDKESQILAAHGWTFDEWSSALLKHK